MSEEAVQKIRGLIIVVLPLVGFAVAVVLLWNRYVFATDLLLLAAMYTVTVLGIGIGYHRMLTHNGFKAPSWLRGLILICGCMAWEGAPIMWTSTHIKHHAHSDEDDDPHSPLHGFWHAHCGWIFSKKSFPDARVYAPQLLQDRVAVFVDRFAWLWMGLALLIPFAIGGWTGLLWGGVVRIFLTTHVTWSVNSICHTFGHRAFETTDESRNEWVIGMLAFGEGWHNNHHAFPANAFHGMRWWQFDLSGLLIRGMEAVGLVWDVQRVQPETVIAHKTRSQAMMHAIAELRATVLASIGSARKELTELGTRLLQNSATPEQIELCKAMQQDALRRLDAMKQAVTISAHLKKQRLLLCQKEAQALVQDCKRRWALVAGEMAVV